MSNHDDSIWQGGYKIPWDDPGFSRRMLAEHLSQAHDMASRRFEWVDRQVAWIHERLLNQEPAAILDLGCGPGFYSHRLASLGHRCRGIDFGPASVEYAREHCADGVGCEFVLGDIREAAFDGPYDLAMILFGELNVFSPSEAASLLRKVRASLSDDGRLIIEASTLEAVEGVGRGEPSEEQAESGLFSDRPHRCRTENRWLAEQKVAVQTFSVTDAADGRTEVYRNTTQAWSDDDLVALVREAGFREVGRCEDWPVNTEALALWMAVKE